ncbi:MAG: formylglycine-generating enzyme family protein [Bacteroidales bacterium]|nr:formylglycine-generating enzyme family protein [Bacteroidales bacterium]
MPSFKSLFLALPLAFMVGCSGGEFPESSAVVDKFDYDLKGVSLHMVNYEGDAFVFGQKPNLTKIDGETAQMVVLDGFAVSETPITAEQWKAVMGKDLPSGYAVSVSFADAKKFANKLSHLTGQKFFIPNQQMLEYALNSGKITTDKKLKEWCEEMVETDSDMARTATAVETFLSGTKSGSIGFRVALNTHVPCSQEIIDKVEGNIVREEGPFKTGYEGLQGAAFKMIAVKGGTFKMGGTSEQGTRAKDDEKPVHEVTVSDFAIAETEVTIQLWLAVMGSVPPGNDPNSGVCPVVNVSWYMAQEFIHKLNSLTGRKFRLPTEAEWEYAARGGKSEGTAFSGSDHPTSVAVSSIEGGKPAMIRTMRPKSRGIYDMAGNVWEWCQDWYGPYSEESQVDPRGPLPGTDKCMRGGSVQSHQVACRVSNRENIPPMNVKNTFGFRLAL